MTVHDSNTLCPDNLISIFPIYSWKYPHLCKIYMRRIP
jgi:hypothetical protein